MNIKQARKIIRRTRRKDILTWYKYLKRIMNEPYQIEGGHRLGLSWDSLPYFGEKQAVRLLCFKNKNFITEKYGYGTYLVWKFNSKLK